MPYRAKTPLIAVSWGELIDKITILEIKCAEITSATALKNVRNELLQLNSVLRKSRVADATTREIRADLTTVNRQLWHAVDALGKKEAEKQFDSTFVELARSIYLLNDRRAALKRRINDHLQSEIVEEKKYL